MNIMAQTTSEDTPSHPPARNARGWEGLLRSFLLAIFSLFVLSNPAVAQSPDLDAHLQNISEQDDVDIAVDKGLAYLAESQHEDGRFGDKKLANVYTALSCMALMASGHFPGRSKYGENLKKGIMYLVEAAEKEDGYYGREGEGRMYSHGICTLALSEAYGMLQLEEENIKIKEALEKAIKVIVKGQVKEKSKHFGGWRYQPNGKDADLSVAVWQALALRSAQNCQIEVPDKTITDALTYIRATFDNRVKAFSYQGGNPSVAMRSAGVVGMLALGANKTDKDKWMIENSGSYLLTQDPRKGGHWWYQSYYLATAANMMGDKHRQAMLPKLEEFIVSLQKPNGEFNKHQGHSEGVYSTAFAVICLSVRDQYLPIYQE
jgi:prenyltransferase beta subunit